MPKFLTGPGLQTAVFGEILFVYAPGEVVRRAEDRIRERAWRQFTREEDLKFGWADLY